jgi:hypothetical protein
MWAVLLALLGCTGATGDTGALAGDCDADTGLPAACACEPATIEVGTGADAFEAVAEGDPVTMVHGPQGGWHVLGSARVANLAPIVAIHYTVTVEPEGVLVSDNDYRVQMLADGACGGTYPGMYGYLNVSALATGDADTPPELLAGRTLGLRMEATDVAGRAATDELSVVAALDPKDEAADTGGH